jgi:hypothetical protein
MIVLGNSWARSGCRDLASTLDLLEAGFLAATGSFAPAWSERECYKNASVAGIPSMRLPLYRPTAPPSSLPYRHAVDRSQVTVTTCRSGVAGGSG